MNGSVLVAILDPNREQVLLTKRRDVPVWVFPGGEAEPNETEEGCAIREALEETGYQIEIIRKVGEYTPRNRLSRYTHFFEARVAAGSPQLSSETKEIGWFSIEQLPYPLPPPYETMLQQALYAKECVRTPVPDSSYWIFLKCLLKRPDLIFRFLAMKCGYNINT